MGGEGALWMAWRYLGDMRALTSMDVLTVNAAKFGDAFTSHMEAFALARFHALAFWSSLQDAEGPGTPAAGAGKAVVDWPSHFADVPSVAVTPGKTRIDRHTKELLEIQEAEEMDAAFEE